MRGPFAVLWVEGDDAGDVGVGEVAEDVDADDVGELDFFEHNADAEVGGGGRGRHLGGG